MTCIKSNWVYLLYINSHPHPAKLLRPTLNTNTDTTTPNPCATYTLKMIFRINFPGQQLYFTLKQSLFPGWQMSVEYQPELDPGWKRTRVVGLGWGRVRGGPGFGDMQVSDHVWNSRVGAESSLFFRCWGYVDIGKWWIGGRGDVHSSQGR
jgi:hypothetical protein